jgi:polysaccharide biosynthesis PFTS motif protein
MTVLRSIVSRIRRRRIRMLLRRTRALRRLHAAGRDLDHFCLLEHIPQNADLRLPPGAFAGLARNFENETETLLRQMLFAHTRTSGVWGSMVVQLAGMEEKLVLAGPAGWRREFERHGFKVAHGRSRLALFWEQLRGLRRAAALLTRYLRRAIRRNAPAPNSYAVVHGARSFYLPHALLPPSERWDWISGYRRSSVFDSRIHEIWAVIHEPYSGKDLSGIRPVMHPLPDFGSNAMWAAFLLEAAARTGWAVLRWLAGAWWAPLALPYVLDLCYSRRLQKSDLPLQVVFNSTEKTIRPLWTYDLERRGTRVLMFLYSMNNVAFAPRSAESRFSEPDFCHVSWPEYVVWGDEHAAMLKKVGVRRGRFTAIGAIGFADDVSDLPELPARCIAVFDVEAHRAVDLGIQGFPRPYWDHDTCYRFVEDAFVAIRKLGATPLYKPKGYLHGRLIRPKGAMFLDLVRRYDAVLIDGFVNPNRIMPHVDAVVSMPFTSTAAAALVFGRPSVYFDPTGTLEPFIQLACGLPLMLSRGELENWLSDALAQRAGVPFKQAAQ